MYRRRDLLEAPGERKEAIWEVLTLLPTWGFPGGSVVKNSSANAGDSLGREDTLEKEMVSCLAREDNLEKGMANHFSILASRNPLKV